MAAESNCKSTTLGPAANARDAMALQYIQEITTNANQVQADVLREILSANAETEYLKRFDLRGASDEETFKAKVPVIDYDHVKAEIQRIANGDRSAVLVARPITEFLTSSGTSGGERKLMPLTEEETKHRMGFYAFIPALINMYIPDLDKGKGLSFYFASSETRTPGGHPIRQTTTSLYKTKEFRMQLHSLTSPLEAILCLDYAQSMYVQMLCGLYHRAVVRSVGTIFASALLRAIRFLQLHYQELAHDISTGTLSSRITDESLKGAVSSLLKPDPDLGQLILKECSEENWEGIVRRIWPKAKFMGAILTGSMAQYVPPLEHFSGGLPLVSILYGSSECFFGINMKPTCKPSEVSYTFMPNMAYFEFIPLVSEKGAMPVGLTQVEVEKEYEVVVTTYTGLYRYRVGDVLRVTGFHNAAPQFQFLRRRNVILSIESDMTDEVELQRGVDSASRLLEEYGTSVAEYTSCAETKNVPGHYVIYLELHSKDCSRKPDGEVMERCCEAIEEEMNAMYRQHRAEHGSISALEIRVVREGTFDEIMNLAVSRGTSIGQYKVPRCVSSTPVLEILDSNVVSSHLSRRLPSWTHNRQ